MCMFPLMDGNRELTSFPTNPSYLSFFFLGVHVRFLRVYDKSGYHTNRWVRYITKAGSYQIRI